MRNTAPIALSLLFALAACGGPSSPDHGTISRLSSSEAEQVALCEHEVPADVCTRCHPELAGQFQEVGDWCGPHDVPESQCHRCHPDLSFVPPAPLEETADYADLTHEQALGGLENHIGDGALTIVDFYAPWCAPCLNLEVTLHDIANTYPQVAVRKITVNDWEGPVVDRYLSDIEGLPHVVILDADGAQVARLSARDTERVVDVVTELLGE